MLSVSQLRQPPTQSQVTQWMLDTLTAYGFQTTGWQPGRIQRTMLDAVSTAVVSLFAIAAALVEAGFNSYAAGTALHLFSESRFGNSPTAAQKTAGLFTLANTATVPYSVDVGGLVFTNANGVEFVTTAAVTIPASSSGTTVAVEAVLAGAAGNIGNDSTLTMVTPLAGVTATNPSPGDDGAGNPLPWYSLRTGADLESDTALKGRNATQWGLLSTERTATAYEHLALSYDACTKTVVVHDNPRGPGTVDVYVASDTGVLGTADMEAMQALFADYTFATDATWPPTVTDGILYPTTATATWVRQPSTQELDVRGVIYYDPNYAAAEVETAVEQALTDFVATTPIGGRDYSPGPSNVITLGDLLQTLESVTGVRTVTLTTPTGNTAVGASALVVAPTDWSTGRLTYVAVTS